MVGSVIVVVASGISVFQISSCMFYIDKLQTLCRSMRHVPEYFQSTLIELKTIGQVFAEVQAFGGSFVLTQAFSFLRACLEPDHKRAPISKNKSHDYIP
jgi:hypothetical protein